ncbi:hypothetical protein [Planococcus shenhongbingii]|uniref:Phage protein n=1 Tax=Planococcus shenhongbingii TaxID=3058398 RepID=A0ABT8N9W7_9BACL|nr:hypothetical protein [Planococcus sp. N017]MDN7244677.1 hypothetical protein [Planococcus sp. N017]
MKDLIHDQDYGYIEERIKNGKLEVYEFRHSAGTVIHHFIKREIPVRIEGETYYDLITPDSYGGPIISECNEEDKWELVDEFERAFQNYCDENHIICETVSFDPLIANAIDFVCCYEVECIGETTIDTELCTGKKIWNSEVYEKVCVAMEVGLDGDFFPAYRRKNLAFAVNERKV